MFGPVKLSSGERYKATGDVDASYKIQESLEPKAALRSLVALRALAVVATLARNLVVW